MLADKPAWDRVDIGPNERQFDGYPNGSLAEWHERLRLSRYD